MPQSSTAFSISEADHGIETQGGRLFARSWTPQPAGPVEAAPILLMHESLGCVAVWRGFPRALAAATGRRVVAYDRLGYGRSDPYPGRMDFDFIAREAERMVPQVCAQLGLEEFVILGHSVGGGMSIETAARHRSRCAALVTIAAQAFVEDSILAGLRVAKQTFQDPANLARVAKYHGDKARWVVDSWIDTWLAPAFAGWTANEALDAVACPVLAIHGEKDEYGSDAHPNRIAAGRGAARILPGLGHVPHKEQESLVAGLVAAFLEEIDIPRQARAGASRP